MKERLIELIGSKICEDYSPTCDEYEPHSCSNCYANDCKIGELADAILDDGWMRPPCKVGDKVYLLLEKITGEYDVVESICKEIHDKGFGRAYFMHIDCPVIGNTLEFYLEDFGKTVFLTKEEAQKALGGVEE